MNIRQQIINLSNNINTGTIYTDCISCGRKNKLGITKSLDGIIYNCFSQSCRLRGKIQSQLNKDVLSSILSNSQLEAYTAQFNRFRLPTMLIPGYSSVEGVSMALKYNLMDSYQKGLYRTAFDPKLNRQVYFYLNDDKEVVGAVGRALVWGMSKAYIYPFSEKTPWIIGSYKTAVVVEDIFSAIQVYNAGYTGVALSGTNLLIDYAQMFVNYDKIVIALDKDASTKSIDMKKLLDLFCENVVICLIERDLKDSTTQEIRSLVL